MGIGTAIILKAHSSTGGSDLVSAIVKKFNPKVEMGRVIVMMDFIVVLLNVIFLRNIEIGLYSAITIYLMGFMVDIVFEGVFFCKLMVIISDKSELISKEIENKIYRGVTGIYGKGMYTGTDKLVLMCATYRREVANIKELIMKIDKDAFVIVTNSREVFGDGFKRNV